LALGLGDWRAAGCAVVIIEGMESVDTGVNFVSDENRRNLPHDG
jgi:hypothetical protein